VGGRERVRTRGKGSIEMAATETRRKISELKFGIIRTSDRDILQKYEIARPILDYIVKEDAVKIQSWAWRHLSNMIVMDNIKYNTGDHLLLLVLKGRKEKIKEDEWRSYYRKKHWLYAVVDIATKERPAFIAKRLFKIDSNHILLDHGPKKTISIDWEKASRNVEFDFEAYNKRPLYSIPMDYDRQEMHVLYAGSRNNKKLFVNINDLEEMKNRGLDINELHYTREVIKRGDISYRLYMRDDIVDFHSVLYRLAELASYKKYRGSINTKYSIVQGNRIDDQTRVGFISTRDIDKITHNSNDLFMMVTFMKGASSLVDINDDASAAKTIQTHPKEEETNDGELFEFYNSEIHLDETGLPSMNRILGTDIYAFTGSPAKSIHITHQPSIKKLDDLSKLKNAFASGKIVISSFLFNHGSIETIEKKGATYANARVIELLQRNNFLRNLQANLPEDNTKLDFIDGGNAPDPNPNFSVANLHQYIDTAKLMTINTTDVRIRKPTVPPGDIYTPACKYLTCDEAPIFLENRGELWNPHTKEKNVFQIEDFMDITMGIRYSIGKLSYTVELAVGRCFFSWLDDNNPETIEAHVKETENRFIEIPENERTLSDYVAYLTNQFMNMALISSPFVIPEGIKKVDGEAFSRLMGSLPSMAIEYIPLTVLSEYGPLRGSFLYSEKNPERKKVLGAITNAFKTDMKINLPSDSPKTPSPAQPATPHPSPKTNPPAQPATPHPSPKPPVQDIVDVTTQPDAHPSGGDIIRPVPLPQPQEETVEAYGDYSAIISVVDFVYDRAWLFVDRAKKSKTYNLNPRNGHFKRGDSVSLVEYKSGSSRSGTEVNLAKKKYGGWKLDYLKHGGSDGIGENLSTMIYDTTAPMNNMLPSSSSGPNHTTTHFSSRSFLSVNDSLSSLSSLSSQSEHHRGRREEKRISGSIRFTRSGSQIRFERLKRRPSLAETGLPVDHIYEIHRRNPKNHKCNYVPLGRVKTSHEDNMIVSVWPSDGVEVEIHRPDERLSEKISTRLNFDKIDSDLRGHTEVWIYFVPDEAARIITNYDSRSKINQAMNLDSSSVLLIIGLDPPTHLTGERYVSYIIYSKVD